MKRLMTAAMLIAFGAGAVWAETDVIAQRRALMHNDGIASKKLVDMFEDRTPFNLSVAQDALKTLERGATETPKLFPDNSKTGGGTAALPSIWQNKADFDGRFAKFRKDISTALAETDDVASFKKVAPAVFQNCGGCHELYRAKSG